MKPHRSRVFGSPFHWCVPLRFTHPTVEQVGCVERKGNTTVSRNSPVVRSAAVHAPCFETVGMRVNRRGAASIVALAVLAIFAGVIAQQTRRVLMERRQMRDEVAFLQTEKLADAGMLLARKSKVEDPAWMGLTWNLPAGAIHQTNSAVVVITVQEDSCTVVARYPSNTEIPFQVTRTRKLTP